MLDPKLTQYIARDENGNEIDLTRYQALPGGRGVVVPRRGPGGSNPMVDPRKGASQFTVVDVDEDEHGNLTTTVHPPGTTDVSGNPIKETQCPTPSPDPKTSAPSRKGPPEAQPSPKESSPAPKPRRARATPTCQPTSTPSLELLTTLQSELSQLREQIQAMSQLLQELPSSLQSKPASVTSSDEGSAPIQVEFNAPYGVFRCLVHRIQRDDGLLVLVYRQDAEVQFIPAPGTDVQISWEGNTVQARPHGLAFRLGLAHPYLVVLLSVTSE